MSTPQTDRGWAKALAAVHPDIGGDSEAFITLQEQRDVWKAKQPKLCGWWKCKKPLPNTVGVTSHKPKYCNRNCANCAIGEKRRKLNPRKLEAA